MKATYYLRWQVIQLLLRQSILFNRKMILKNITQGIGKQYQITEKESESLSPN